MMGRKVASAALLTAFALAACNDPETYREPRRPALDGNGNELATQHRREPEHTERAEHDSILPWLLFGASTAHTEWRHGQAKQRDDEREHRHQPVYTPAPRYRPSAPRPALAPKPARPSTPPTYRYVPKPAYRPAPRYNRPPTPAYRPSPSRGGRR